MIQSSETRSEFPFNDGDRRLIVIAPDDPEARPNRKKLSETLWRVAVVDRKGEECGNRTARQNASAMTVWLDVQSLLYGTVTGIDRVIIEAEAWTRQVYAAYEARRANAQTH